MKGPAEVNIESRQPQETEWDNPAERSEQEKQDRFQRFGQKVVGALRRLFKQNVHKTTEPEEFRQELEEDIVENSPEEPNVGGIGTSYNWNRILGGYGYG